MIFLKKRLGQHFLKDNNIETKKIVLEIKTNPEKHLSVEFDIKSIFQFQESYSNAL